VSALSAPLSRAADEGLEANARRWFAFADRRPGELVELQALKVPFPDGTKRSLYAHASSAASLVCLLAELDAHVPHAEAIYVIANPVPASVPDRDPSQPPGAWYLAERGNSTTDEDVVYRAALFVDVDADRKSGSSATEAELTLAREVAARMYVHLTTTIARCMASSGTTPPSGYDAVAVGHSGNGCSVFVALDHLQETPEVRSLVDGVLRVLKVLFESPGVKVDAHLTDPKRLVPAFGTLKCKGPPDNAERPHRRTAVLVPANVRRLTLDELRRLREAYQAEVPVAAPHSIPPAYTPTTPAYQDDGDLTDPPDDSLDLGDLRKRLSGLRRRKAASVDPAEKERFDILTRILAGAPLAQRGERASTMNRAMWILARALPLGTPWEIAAELVRPAVAAMDLTDEDASKSGNVDYWLGPDQGQGSYERAMAHAFAEDNARRLREERTRSAMLASAPQTAQSQYPSFAPWAPAASAAAPALGPVPQAVSQALVVGSFSPSPVSAPMVSAMPGAASGAVAASGMPGVPAMLAAGAVAVAGAVLNGSAPAYANGVNGAAAPSPYAAQGVPQQQQAPQYAPQNGASAYAPAPAYAPAHGAHGAHGAAAFGSGMPGSPPAPLPADDGWTGLFLPTADGRIVQCGANVYIALKFAPELRGMVRFNLVTKDIEVRGGPFANIATSTLSTAIMNWLHFSKRMTQVTKGWVEDQLLLVARENDYDPIQEYLNSLVWDGVPRIDDFLLKYARSRTTSEDGRDITPHLRRIGAKFLIGAAARALRPGEKLDTILVLEGPEGKGKTSLLEIMFGKWYLVTKLDVGNKDTQAIGAENWGIELGELQIGRSEDNALKSFTTTRKDKFRPPYARRSEEFPRRSVLIGTTNEPRWLTVGKGLRRWWVAWVESVDLAAALRDRDQLWAEAVARYRGYVDELGAVHAAERWHLVDEEWAEADREAAARVEESHVQQRVAKWFYDKEPNHRPHHVTIADVAELLQIQTPQVRGMTAEIRHALGRLGFQKGRLGDVECWVTTEAMQKRVYERKAMTQEQAIRAMAEARVKKP
jgi:predicted P-loop ATPase